MFSCSRMICKFLSSISEVVEQILPSQLRSFENQYDTLVNDPTASSVYILKFRYHISDHQNVYINLSSQKQVWNQSYLFFLSPGSSVVLPHSQFGSSSYFRGQLKNNRGSICGQSFQVAFPQKYLKIILIQSNVGSFSISKQFYFIIKLLEQFFGGERPTSVLNS